MAFNWNSMVIYLFSLLLLFTIFWMWFLVIIFLCLLFFPKNLKNPNKLQIFSFLSHFCIIYVLDFITADSSSKFLCLVLNLIHKKSRNRGCRKGPPSLSVTTSNIVVPPLQTLNLHTKNVSPNWTTRFAKPLSQNLHILLVQSAYSPCFYEGDQRLLDTFQVRHGRRHCAGKCGCRFKSRYGCTDCVGSIFVDFFFCLTRCFFVAIFTEPTWCLRKPFWRKQSFGLVLTQAAQQTRTTNSTESKTKPFIVFAGLTTWTTNLMLHVTIHMKTCKHVYCDRHVVHGKHVDLTMFTMFAITKQIQQAECAVS